MKSIKVSTNEVQQFEREHLDALRTIAPECMVLLKKNGDFPLAAPCKVALYGAGARNTIKGGTGSGDVNVRHFTTVEEGLEKAGFTITTQTWLDGYDRARKLAQADFYTDIIAQAKREGKSAFLVGLGKVPAEPRHTLPIDGTGDVGIYVLSRNSGEGADRSGGEGDLLLSVDEIRDISACAARYPKFMLVLNTGGVVDISPVLDQVENILLLSQLGSSTGDAFADVLLGKAAPSGKLTSTWARAEDYPSIGDFGMRDDTRYQEGIYVGYRHFDATGIAPLFPFGFGLSYTDFSVTAEHFRVEDGAILLNAKIQNTGSFAGKETVQLWYSAPSGKLDKPVRELGTYAKTRQLLPGENEVLTLSLPMENMASWDEEGSAWLLEKGRYVLSLGDTPCGVVELDRDAVVKQASALDGGADFQEWKPDVHQSETAKDLPVVTVCAQELENRGHYDRGRAIPETLECPDLSGFSIEELAQTCIGKYSENQGITSIIGNAAAAIAGAAGETADLVRDKGFGKMILADGPAGIRVASSYIERGAGAEGLNSGSLAAMINLFDEPTQQLVRAKCAEVQEAAKTMPVYYHYASAIPIGTALAQAWNLEAVRSCGEIVGNEMERFGVDVWLAPALNIHRSPLCGRNFEYYSEDPVVSGRTAAAVTQGVQSRPGCAVTIKHFCCNNQETNRFGSNSIVGERALREIYLKGFEICVKESAPKSLMTSYNLLGGIHTANRRDLLTAILREEWGFAGFVMTDWSTTTAKMEPDGKYGAASAAMCIRAGNDLIMPGCRADLDGILAGLDEGIITREELETCAGRILVMARRLSGEA